MKFKALQGFDSDELGRIKKGQTFEATAAQVGGVDRFIEPVKKKATPKK